MIMIKLIVGAKGSGKTKVLVTSANETVEKSNGCVVFIAKGSNLIHEVRYSARFIDTDEYGIDDFRKLYGMIAGVISSNYDAHDIFLDSALKIIGGDTVGFEQLIQMLAGLCEAHSINMYITSSIKENELAESLKKYTV